MKISLRLCPLRGRLTGYDLKVLITLTLFLIMLYNAVIEQTGEVLCGLPW